ncbi:hypothetical protein HDU83_002807 [Entophlyctis luteolus]|nr:hypothetical protein HDU83_002807 [Entophlyctis luteolus]
MVEHVAITGGNGFIASHIIHQLLEADREPPYKVTATVRSLERGNCIADLPHARHRLFLRVANLMEPNSFDFAGQDVVIHTASPVLLDAVKDAKSEIVDPAVSGTLAVLHAAMKAKTVKIFVLTSSLSAVTEGPQFGKVINETEWNTDSTLKGNPYPYSKVCAERAAWNFMESNPHCGFKLFVRVLLGAPWCV